MLTRSSPALLSFLPNTPASQPIMSQHAIEKGEVNHSDKFVDNNSDQYSPDPYHNKIDDVEQFEQHRSIDEGYDPQEVSRTVRKVDLRLIPILSAMYCISLIDRTNLSLARAANKLQMNVDLQLANADGSSVGNRYGLATVMFFIPYM